ncbi:MAG TPA: hypothetical protein P5055_13320 [Candidatus Paceibacterota bacterium]|nr:hypothetical protein [Verrucomicrobiota bacterium]HSA01710.1 hypothetical protein [Candidatus Paceibacterota bacterium]
MSIAILGWGSLIWNPRDLPITGDWQGDGPVLPIEFTRISDNGRLTLVIDERHGVDVPTLDDCGRSSAFIQPERLFHFSVSPSHQEAVRRYILKQEDHHRNLDFKTELLRVLEKYQAQYDERYLWD